VRSIAWEQALILVGLALLFIFSFLGGWIQLSFTCPANDVYCTSNSATVDSLWNGFGILPALIIVVAVVWFVVTEIPAVRLVAPVRASTAWRETWIAFAAVEIVLFVMDWLIEGSGYSGYSSTPGWVLIISIILAAVVGIGGYLERQRGLRLAAASGPASGTATLPAGPVGMPAGPLAAPAAGTLSPDRSEWFDGTAWRDASLSAPPGALRSPDGSHWWDGATWRAIPRWGVRPYGEPPARRPRFSEGTAEPEPGGGEQELDGHEDAPDQGEPVG
jgi:hypothetical protein